MLSKKDKLKLFIIAIASTSVVISHYKSIKPIHSIKKDLSSIEIKTSEQRYNDLLSHIKKLEEEKKKKEEQKRLEEQRKKEEWIPVRLSFYTNSYENCAKTNAISASGINLSRGGNYIATPKNIPFGTKLYIEGLGKVYEVVDRGGAIVWKNGVMHIDVFVPNASQEELMGMGVKYSKAKIIKNKIND